MGWLTFISKLVDSLAWPMAVAISVWLFRDKLVDLLPLLRVRHKDWEASFRLDQAEEDAAELPTANLTPENEPTPEEKSKFEKIAEISPRAAILEVRTDIEEAVRALARTKNMLTPKVQTTVGLTRLLRNNGAIDHQTAALLDDLRVLGNSAAHNLNVQFSKEDALRFRALADQTIAQLQSSSD